MSSGMNLVVYPVSDLAGATALYRKLLGVEPYLEQPYYVGFRVGDFEFGLDPNGHKAGLTGPVGYVTVADIKDAVDTLLTAGAQIVQEIRDVGGGKLVATVKDSDGNIAGLTQEG
jgi:predicted enzyme related to lactoylglutathione lyase